MLKIIKTDIVIRSFFTKKQLDEGQENGPVSVPKRWFRKLQGIQKI